MKKLQQCVLAMAVAGVLTPLGTSWALDIPRAFKADARMRYANYSAENVIQLDAVLGVATMIELEPGEEYVYHVYGDSAAYSFTVRRNYLFFKPVQEQADTNLLVLTNRRTYQFKVNYFEDSAKALYKLSIRYPDSDAAAVRAHDEQQALASGLADTQAPINWQAYTMSGDRALAPVHAWDDGRQTWLQFPPGADLPAVYRVTSDGQETVANFHMAGPRTIALHHTAAKWHLRAGDQVLAVHNEAFGATSVPARTGTISQQVERTVLGAAPAAPVLEDRPAENLPAIASQSPETEPMPGADGEAVPTAVDLSGKAALQQPASPASPPNAPATHDHAQPQAQPQEPLPQDGSAAAPPAAQPASAKQSAADDGEGHSSTTGDLRLMPKKVWVDGEITRMQFASANMPAVFAVDAQGQEQFVGLDIEPGNILAIHARSDRWHLKQGDASLTFAAKEP